MRINIWLTIITSFFYLIFFIVPLNTNAQLPGTQCGGCVRTTCTKYTCSQSGFWWEGISYSCDVVKSASYTQQCTYGVFNPGQCIYTKQTLSNYCNATSTGCNIVNCDPDFTGGDGAPGWELPCAPNVACPGGGGCTNAVFNAGNSTYGPGTSRDPGQLYGVNCDYGVQSNNIGVRVGGSPGNCTFYSFEPAPNGKQAQFGCTAPSTPGSYRVECYIASGGSGNICSASTNYRFDLTVNGAPTSPAIGYLDGANCSYIAGWAYDPDVSSNEIDVHVYKDGPAGTGTFVTSAATSGLRQDVNNAYGISGNHGFTITTPASLIDGNSHSIYVYAIDKTGDNNNEIRGSPKTIQCFPPTPTGLSASCPSVGTTATLSWTPVSGATNYQIHVDDTDNKWGDCQKLSAGDFCNENATSSPYTPSTSPGPYSWRIRATNSAGGSSAFTSWQPFTCISPTPTPIPPTPTNTPTPTPTPIPPTPTNTPTPTPTPVPAFPWYKLKDASLVGISSINNPIPASPLTPYDADDPGNRYLIDKTAGNDAGVVSAQNITLGGASVSTNNWSVAGKTYSEQTTISKFIDYVETKKSSLVNNGSIVVNKINILLGNQTITEAMLSGKRPLMVIVEGNITLSGASINASNEQQIIMATGTITFPVAMSVANGLYIADSLDFGTTANQGIKIIGNIIAQSSFSNARQWSDWKKPGLFLIFDPSHYIGMLDMLSTITYDWRQIQ